MAVPHVFVSLTQAPDWFCQIRYIWVGIFHLLSSYLGITLLMLSDPQMDIIQIHVLMGTDPLLVFLDPN
jgi:hypothetical protein